MIRRPPRSTPKPSSAASDVYKRQVLRCGGTRWLYCPFRRALTVQQLTLSILDIADIGVQWYLGESRCLILHGVSFWTKVAATRSSLLFVGGGRFLSSFEYMVPNRTKSCPASQRAGGVREPRIRLSCIRKHLSLVEFSGTPCTPRYEAIPRSDLALIRRALASDE